MQVIILAGGRGTRLKPYTNNFPKSLVPVGDHPILEILLKQVSRYNIKEIIISTGHLAELIMAYFGNGEKWGMKIRYVREEKPLNTAGALKLIPNLDDNFLVMNADILTSLNFQVFFDHHLSQKADATISTFSRETKIDFGVLEIGNSKELTNYIEKPVYKFKVSMGIYALSKSLISLIKDSESIGMPDLLVRALDQKKKVITKESDCYWLDIGRVDDYEKAQEKFTLEPNIFLDK